MLRVRDRATAQVSFSREGDALIVTGRVASRIDTFEVGNDGLTAGGKNFPSAGMTPFGFDVGRQNRLFVSEAAGGAANASSASAYELCDRGDLAVAARALHFLTTVAGSPPVRLEAGR